MSKYITKMEDRAKKITPRTQPVIGIIIPVYNVELYLDRCVQSLLNQSYNNIRLILVDDGSQDHSPEICDKYSEIDFVKVVHRENGASCIV